MLYLEVGRRLGLNLFGVSFPTHFLVKAVDERGELIIDPFDGGDSDLDEIRARLTQIYGQPVELHPAMLKPTARGTSWPDAAQSEDHLYGRLDWTRALSALDRILCSIRARSTS